MGLVAATSRGTVMPVQTSATPCEINTLVDRLTYTRGETPETIRHLVQQRAAAHSYRFAVGCGNGLTPLIEAYVDRVALHAYRVTDREIEILRAAGCSEDAIFELTLCAAVGAAIGRMGQAASAMRGER